MRKVLIVDDEKYIRKGLKVMIEREETAFKHIYEVKNVKEAIDVIQEEGIDLVITDIRMPQRDGFDLLKHINTMEKKPYTIILSGYDEFDYAKKAMKYGVKAYLLKPLKRDELLEELKRAENEINRNERLQTKIQKVNNYFSELQVNGFNYIFYKEKLGEEEIQNIIKNLELDFLNNEFYVAMLDASNKYQSGINESNIESLKSFIDDYIQKTDELIACIIDMDNNIVLITDINTDLQGLMEAIKEEQGYMGIMTVSKQCIKMTQLRKAYLQAKEAITYSILKPAGSIVYFNEISNLTKDFSVPLDKIKKLHEMIGTDRIDEIECLLQQILNKEALEVYHISYLESIIKGLNEHVIKYYMDQIPQKMSNLDDKYEQITSIKNFDSVESYYDAVLEWIIEVNNYLKMLKDTNNSGRRSEIDEAIQYIMENYDKDLNMAVVANHISLNYSYFSQIFKENTGTNFVDFIKKVRIDKAKELLVDSDFKVGEVARKVGYPDSKHFSKIFRATVGISPKEYRDKHIQIASDYEED